MGVYLDFLVIPTPVLRSKVPDSAKIVYGVIYALSQLSSGGCTASNETIMQIADIHSEDTFKRLLRALENKQLIKRYYDNNGRRLAIRPLVVFAVQKSGRKSVENLGRSMSKSEEKGVSKITPPGGNNDTRKRKQEKESNNSYRAGGTSTTSMAELVSNHRFGGNRKN